MNNKSFQNKLVSSASRGELAFLAVPDSGARCLDPPRDAIVLALSPHQDDPEAVAVTLRTFALAGCRVRYCIVCSSYGGVTDSFALKHAGATRPAHGDELDRCKGSIRRAEQLEAARLAGFVDGAVEFLTVREDERGNLIESEANSRVLRASLERHRPDIAIMPYGEDTNSAHRLVYSYFRRHAPTLAAAWEKPLLGLYNRDPKTVRISDQLVVPFDSCTAEWKAGLLRAHKSQQERNLEQRGYGFDERLLRDNRESWEALKARIGEPWTERYSGSETFQVECFMP